MCSANQAATAAAVAVGERGSLRPFGAALVHHGAAYQVLSMHAGTSEHGKPTCSAGCAAELSQALSSTFVSL